MVSYKSICLIGSGASSSRVAELLAQCCVPVKIEAVAVRNPNQLRQDLPVGTRVITDALSLSDMKLDLVVEAAGRDSVLYWGSAALDRGIDFAVSSTSAFVHQAILSELLDKAKGSGARLLIPSGALAGIDALSAASRLSLDAVVHKIIKPPRAWLGTAAESMCDLQNLKCPQTFFTGTAREGANIFPQNANATMITSLAGIGPDKTTVVMVADPSGLLNTHEITANGAFGRLKILVENEPLASNPKSSEMTALNLVRMIENRVSSLVL